MTDEPVADDEGIAEDSDAGYEMATVEDLPGEKVETTATTAQKVIAFIKNEAKEIKKALVGEKLPEWLIRTWNFAGRKSEYTAYELRWMDEYPNLWQLVKQAVKDGLIDARSTPEPDPRYPDGTPNEHLIMLKPRTLEMLRAATKEKPGVKTNARQVTAEDGTKFDMRSGRVYMLAKAAPEDLENITYSLLHQLRTSQVKAVQRRMKSELHDILLLRGRDLPKSLYDTVNLRLRGQLTEIADSVFDDLEQQPDGTYLSKGPMWTTKVSYEPWT